MIKSGKMRQAGHAKCMEKMETAHYILVVKSGRKSPCERRMHFEKIILTLMLKKWGQGHGVHSSGSGQGPVTSSCEHGKEASGSIKCGEFTDQLGDYLLVKKNPV
jgi:hypothetical protein